MLNFFVVCAFVCFCRICQATHDFISKRGHHQHFPLTKYTNRYIFTTFAPVTKADRTRQYIIEKTAPLFNSKGFDGTSLAELTEATGLTKGALYGNFRDKEELALEAFLYSIAKVKQVVKKELEGTITCKEQHTNADGNDQFENDR